MESDPVLKIFIQDRSIGIHPSIQPSTPIAVDHRSFAGHGQRM